jgi:hypothetical protein
VTDSVVEQMCSSRLLGPFLAELRERYGRYQLIDRWTQGEYHHDIVIGVPADARADKIPQFVVVAINCNGGIKEVMGFDKVPQRDALWHYRCPENPEFRGELPPMRLQLRTEHWFDPRELLTAAD